MQIGIKQNLKDESLMFYEYYYDIVATTVYKEKTRLLKTEHGCVILETKMDAAIGICQTRS